MLRMSRLPMLLSGLASLAMLATAQAQTPPKGPTPPKAPTKPVSTIKPIPAPTTGPVELFCRGLGQNGATSTNAQSVVTYERITVRDAAGAPKTFYAPVEARITSAFSPSAEAATGRGKRLANGSCGLATSVIAPVPGSPLLKLVMSDPAGFTLTSTTTRNGVGASLAMHEPVITLPACPSGVRSFRAQRTSPTEFVVSLAATNATSCVE